MTRVAAARMIPVRLRAKAGTGPKLARGGDHLGEAVDHDAVDRLLGEFGTNAGGEQVEIQFAEGHMVNHHVPLSRGPSPLFVALALITALAGLPPARRAARVSPVAALGA